MPTINGSDRDDTLVGTGDDDVIFGGNGRDSIEGNGGADTIFGGGASDSISGGLGDDVIDGGSSRDTIDAGDGNDIVDGGNGEDSIIGGLGDDTLDGGQGQDTVDGGVGNDSLAGGQGDDDLFGGTGNDELDGGQGQDELFGGAGDDVLSDGDQTSGNKQVDSLYGGDGNDTLIAGGNSDQMFGGADDDTFIVESGGNGVFNQITINGGEDPGDTDFDVIDLSELQDAYPDLTIIYESGGPGDENGTIRIQTAPNGQTLGRINYTGIEAITTEPIICFTPGTLIATHKGRVPVEKLQPGDMVVTRDNGAQEIAWVGRKDLGAVDLLQDPQLRPVRIKAGTFGPGLPERDLIVSPQHRLLLQGHLPQLYFDESEVLSAAVHLTDQPGIEQIWTPKVSYIHLMFERHEVINSNGAWTESFQPGAWGMSGLNSAQKSEILSLFPELEARSDAPQFGAARRVLRRFESSLLA